jgi:MoaA/NifB/PqqE/SkfB family radical SAM enzyme
VVIRSLEPTNGELQLEQPVVSELLAAAPLHEVRLALTTRCNLRCVYCAVSQNAYHGEDLPKELARKALQIIPQIVDKERIYAVNVNGHGETTFVPGWTETCTALLDENLPLVLTTNLAKSLSKEEAEVLARMRALNVSIDSSDAGVLRRMRRNVDVRQILTNITFIRVAARRLGITPPAFRFSCGLYDQNSLFVEDLARLAVEYKIERVGFWNLNQFPYEYTDVPVADRARPLDELSDEDLRPRLEAIDKAIRILKENHVVVEIAGDFVDDLVHRPPKASEPADSAPLIQIDAPLFPAGMTRDCLDPWNYIEFGTGGEIKPCCAHASIGDWTKQNPTEILNGKSIRQLRADLLNGTPDADCRSCRLRGVTTTQILAAKVRDLYQPPEPVFVCDTNVLGIARAFFTECWLWLRLKIRLRTRLRHLKKGNREIRGTA